MGSNPAIQPILCWFCGADLVYGTSESGLSRISSSPSLVEKPYLAALLGVSPEPALLGQVTAQQFRRFVDDMFQLFSWYQTRSTYLGRGTERQLYRCLEEKC
jgi:hypothetical protein